MRALLALASLLLPLPALAGPAQAPCPTERHELVDDLVEAAPSCQAAAELALACAVGSGGDVARANVARERCEATFLPRLDAAGRGAYRRALGRCQARYRRDEGTMYRSLESLCALREALGRAPRGAPRDAFGWVVGAIAALPPSSR